MFLSDDGFNLTKCKKRSMMLLKIESVRGEQLSGTPETHRLVWSGVQLPCNGIQLRLRVSTQVSVLRSGLPDAAMPIWHAALNESQRELLGQRADRKLLGFLED